MTSGHGSQWEPQGQPPPWQQPGPPYGPPGPPPYGYGPMPSAGHGQPPPEPRERPLTVRAGLGAFMASFLLGLGSSVLTWTDPQGGLQVPTDPDFQEQTGIDPEVFSEAAQQGTTAFSVVLGLVFAGAFLLFIWFAWKGHNWARIVLWVLSGLTLVSAPLSLGLLGQIMPASQVALLLFQLLALLVGVVLLALKPSNEWFAHEKWRRATTPPR